MRTDNDDIDDGDDDGRTVVLLFLQLSFILLLSRWVKGIVYNVASLQITAVHSLVLSVCVCFFFFFLLYLCLCLFFYFVGCLSCYRSCCDLSPATDLEGNTPLVPFLRLDHDGDTTRFFIIIIMTIAVAIRIVVHTVPGPTTCAAAAPPW